MGAANFTEYVPRSADVTTSLDAFRKAVSQSRAEYGASYSGEIGMKDQMTEAKARPDGTAVHNFMADVWETAFEGKLPGGTEPTTEMVRCAREADDKYGKAVCVPVGEASKPEGWYFFGTAAS